ncbi:MAG: AbrB/MazE/SpoVT family DNA-binding domain-containing protein [Bacilli bacterium]|nr:AbrB/MazE/SpoVT family DNA-binding domain-containing protein [Bacilli bacterium]
MNTKGIIRRIDELGRVVIPVEIRKYLNINEGENIEFTINNDVILLQKKSTSKQNIKVLEDIDRTLSSVIDGEYIITDREKVLYSSNKSLIDTFMNNKLISFLNSKEECIKISNNIVQNKDLYLFIYSFDNNAAGFIVLFDVSDINKYTKLIKFLCIYLNNLLSIS